MRYLLITMALAAFNDFRGQSGTAPYTPTPTYVAAVDGGFPVNVLNLPPVQIVTTADGGFPVSVTTTVTVTPTPVTTQDGGALQVIMVAPVIIGDGGALSVVGPLVVYTPDGGQSVTVSNFPASQTVVGTVAVTQVGVIADGGTLIVGTPDGGLSVSINNSPAVTVTSGSITATQATGTNLHVVVDSAPSTAVTGTVAVSQVGVIADGGALATTVVAQTDGGLPFVNVANSPAVTVTSGSITATQATGSNLHVQVDTAPTTAVTGTVSLGAGTATIGYVFPEATDAGVAVFGTADGGLSVSINNSPSVTVTSGTVIATQATGTNLHVVVDTAPSTAVTGTVAVSQVGVIADGGAIATTVVAQTDGGLPFVQIAGTVTVTGGAAASAVAIYGVDAGAIYEIPIATDGGIALFGTADGGLSVSINNSPAVTVTSGSITATQATGSNLHVQVDTAPTTAVTIATLPSGTIADAGALQVNLTAQTDGGLPYLNVANFPASQTVTGTVAVSQVGVVADGGALATTVVAQTDGGLPFVQIAGTVTVTGGASASAVAIYGVDAGAIYEIPISTDGGIALFGTADGGLSVSINNTPAVTVSSGSIAVTQVGVIADGGVLSTATPDTAPAGQVLAANAAACTVTVAGQRGVSVVLPFGATFAGTVKPQVSPDNGATWNNSTFIDEVTGVIATQLVLTNANPGSSEEIVLPAGTRAARVFVTAYTSGTLTCSIEATQNTDSIAYSKLTDGTNVAFVKPGSTLALASDSAAVVAVRDAVAVTQIGVISDGGTLIVGTPDGGLSVSVNNTVTVTGTTAVSQVGVIADGGALQTNLTAFTDGGLPYVNVANAVAVTQVGVIADGGILAAGVPNVTNSGSITANSQTVSLTLSGQTSASMTIAVASTLVATLQASCVFGTATVPTSFLLATGGTIQGTAGYAPAPSALTTVTGTAYTYSIQVCPGATAMQVASVAFTSGSATVVLNATGAPPLDYIAPGLYSVTVGASINITVPVLPNGNLAMWVDNTGTLVDTLNAKCLYQENTGALGSQSQSYFASFFYPVGGGVPSTTAVLASGTPAAFGVYICPGAQAIEIQTTSYVSGSATVYFSASQGGNNAQFVQATGTQASGTAITANPILTGMAARAQGSTPTPVTAGQAVQQNADLYGDAYVLTGSPNHGNQVTAALSTSLTQQVAAPAAATSIYLQNLTCQSTTGTAATVTVSQGTGTNCGSTNTVMFIVPCPLNTAATTIQTWGGLGYQLPAAAELCAVCSSATNTCKTSFGYYIAN